MKVLCRHCQLPCKRIGLVTCDRYNAKANRPEQLRIQINNLFKQNKYDEARKLQEELFRINHG